MSMITFIIILFLMDIFLTRLQHMYSYQIWYRLHENLISITWEFKCVYLNDILLCSAHVQEVTTIRYEILHNISFCLRNEAPCECPLMLAQKAKLNLHQILIFSWCTKIFVFPGIIYSEKTRLPTISPI